MLIFRKARAVHHLHFFRRPSPKQAAAGNYSKQHIKHQGLDITIENPIGTIREGVDDDGKPWKTAMRNHYGYIRGTLSPVDGDHVDCFMGANSTAPMVYVIDTSRPPHFTEPDEQKCMLGFSHEDHAREAFALHYDNPGFFRSMASMPIESFKAKVLATRRDPALIRPDSVLLKSLLLVVRGRNPYDKDSIWTG
jgi:hypothetical protein